MYNVFKDVDETADQIVQMTPDRHEQRSITRAIGGDAEAYSTLCRRYVEAAYRYFFFRLGSVVVAEELTEALFVRAWEALAQDPTAARPPFSVWLFKQANEIVVEHDEAKAATGIEPPPPPQIAWSDYALSDVPIQIHPRDLARAIRQLDHLAQQVVVLRLILQLSHEEVAAVLDDTEDGSRVLQYRAFTELREVLTHRPTSSDVFDIDYVSTTSFCLDRVVSGKWTVAECLEHVPEASRELKETLRFALIVCEARRVIPRPLFEAGFFATLLSKLRNSERAPQEYTWGVQFVEELAAGIPSPVLAALLIAFITFFTIGGTAGAIAAINTSLPGDPLYRVELRLEQRYLGFLDDPGAQSQFVLGLSEERLQEAETLAERGAADELQVALVAYSLHIGSIAEDVKRVDSVIQSENVDLILAEQQRHLDKILAKSIANSSDTATIQSVASLQCDGEVTPGDSLHPIGVTLAAQHGVRYEELISWVCEGHSFGEIVLALASDVHEQSSPARLLDLKSELGGWGQLWKAMGSGEYPPG